MIRVENSVRAKYSNKLPDLCPGKYFPYHFNEIIFTDNEWSR